MCRENLETFVLHLDQHHHDVIALVALFCKAVLAHIVSVIYAGLIAVMAVSDVKLSVFEIGCDLCDGISIGGLPQSVDNACFVGKLYLGGTLGKLINLRTGLVAVVHIKGIYLGEVAAGSLHKIEAVFLCLGKGLFMGKNNALGELFKLYSADNALDLHCVSTDSKLFLINIKAFFIPCEYTLGKPFAKHVSGLFVRLLALRKLKTDYIMLIFRDITESLLLADDIVGRAAKL